MPVDDLELGFASTAADGADWRVRRVRGREAISEPYRFEIEISASIESFDLDSLLHSSARLTLGCGGKRRHFHGILIECEEVDVDASGLALLHVVLMPQLQLLDLSRRLEARQNLSPIELAVDRMNTCALDVELRLERSYGQREFAVQYRETDLAFASRMLEHEGVSYFFEALEHGERIILTDHNEGFDVAECGVIGFRSGGDLDDSVASLTCRRARTPQRLVLGDYNDRTPEVPLWAEAEVAPQGTGLLSDYGDHFETPEDGAALARIRAEELACRGERYRGSLSTTSSASSAHLRAGYRYTQGGHPREAWNREYLVVEVVHEASAPGVSDTAAWHVEFEAVPMDRPFRPAQRTPKPRLHGSLPAHIDGATDTLGSSGRADRDADGRYKLVLPFDLTGAGKSSPYVRMERPGQGVDFALPSGTEVLWTGLDGDPDRPVITGAVHNAYEAGAVSDAGLLRSNGGASIEFHDGDRAPHQGDDWRRGAMDSADVWRDAHSGLLAPQRPLNGDPPGGGGAAGGGSGAAGGGGGAAGGGGGASGGGGGSTGRGGGATGGGGGSTGGGASDTSGIRAISESGTTRSAYTGTDANESQSFLRMFVPHTDVQPGQEPDPSSASSYFRMGKRPPDSTDPNKTEFERALYNGFKGDYQSSDARDSLDSVYDAEHTHGIFDYTDGDRIIYTGGDRREVIGGTTTTWIKNGTATVYDAEPTYAVTFGPVGTSGHWRKTERKYISEDTYAWGDTEDAFFGYKFDAMLGFKTDIFLGGSIALNAAITADVVCTGGCTWGGAWQYDRTRGGNVSVQADHTNKVHNFLTLRAEPKMGKGVIEPGDKGILALLGVVGLGATAALAAKGHSISGWQGSVYPGVTFGAYAMMVFGSYKSYAKHKSTAKDGDFGSQIDLGLKRLRIAQGDGKEGTVNINLYGDTIEIVSKKVIQLRAEDVNIQGNLNVSAGEIKCWKGISSVGPDNMSNLQGPPPMPPKPTLRPRIRKPPKPA